MPGPTQFRHYLIAQEAGGKNIEVVRSAEQVGVLAFDLERHVFVHFHVLLEPLKDKTVFEERAKQVRARGHTRLARLLDYGEDDGSPFYITTNVDGETLRSYLERSESLPVWLAMQVTHSALEAMQALIEVGDFVPTQPLDALRIIQTGPQSVEVEVADYRLMEEPVGKAAKARQGRSPLEKQGQFLNAFFQERLESGESPASATLQTADFIELLQNLLSACGPEKQEALAALLKELSTLMPPAPPVELPSACKPRPYLAVLLAGFTEVARSIASTVRIQSQKLDPYHPYSLRGTMLKLGQAVVVEQVPPSRLAGTIPAELFQQVQNLPKAGKFPNLVPVLFVEEKDGIQTVAETAVEGVTLQEVLEVRDTLGVQEIYLVLAGVDAALAQLEKAGLPARRLRLEDVFLFTGVGQESPRDSGLLSRKLNEWSGFSVVIRAHPCLHAIAGRGTDPAVLLPLDANKSDDAEPIWNGGWMAALGCFLAGMPDADATKHEAGIAETDSVRRLLEEEVRHAREGAPIKRAAFLAKYARVMQQFDVAKSARTGAVWSEVSGGQAAASAPEAQEAPVYQPKVAGPAPAEGLRQLTRLPEKKGATPPLTSAPAHNPPPKPTIGFAEALIRQTQAHDPDDHYEGGGLRPIRGRMHELPESESSWRPMHEETSLWIRVALLLIGSLVLGAILAHLSGRALWQDIPAPKAVLATDPLAPDAPIIDLPVAPKKQPSSGAPTLPAPTGSSFKDVNLEPKATPPRAGSAAGSVAPAAPRPASAAPPQAPTIAPVPPPPAMTNPVASTSSLPAPVVSPETAGMDAKLDARLAELRLSGGKLPAALRVETERAASRGNAEAMLAMGRSSLRGEVGAVDERAAYIWFEKAAQAGSVPANVPLAECHLQGWGTPSDPVKAVELLSIAVAAGDSQAKDLLGVCYRLGKGVPRDDARAFALCSEAYRAGIVSACGNLGALYLRGQGVAEDAALAVQLFAEGARRGHAESMQQYAHALEYGTGIPADRAQATQWYQKSAALGNAEASAWCREKGVVY
ncbi:Sel1-like repeat-containing protein kinase family protein [Roseimicrobium gellanilyticum]|nr:Sel1-like repeat-containing protein kinase family protein [Roseimicrobium gellanilyticum]